MSYRLSPAARADMRSIWSFSEQRWDRAQADRYIMSITDELEELARGRLKPRSAEHFRAGYLMIAVGSHFVFFKRTADGPIDVIRILHQRMDIRSRLRDR